MSLGVRPWSRHWRPVQAFVPPRLRVDPTRPPKEEWKPVGDALVHLDRYLPQRPAPARAIVLHGGGTHGGFLSPFGVMVQRQGFEAVLPDLPGYGRTQVADRRALRYSAWVDTATELVEQETANDPRPVVLLGLSMGGMLAYDVAGRRNDIAAVITSCLLDPTEPTVRRQIARTPLIGRMAEPMLRRTARFTDRLGIPMRFVAPIHAIAADPELAHSISVDPAGGGTWMPAGWIRTYLQSTPAVPPQQFRSCPVILAQPDADTWTPLELSRPFLDRIAGPTEIVTLHGASHACIEDPGAQELEDLLGRVLTEAAESG